MKPLIGLNVDISPGPPVKATIKEDYYTSVLKAGAVPVILPPMPDGELQIMLDRLDGLILIGGADYSPSCYGEKLDGNGELLDERRQDFDLRLVDHAMMRTALPILGICG